MYTRAKTPRHVISAYTIYAHAGVPHSLRFSDATPLALPRVGACVALRGSLIHLHAAACPTACCCDAVSAPWLANPLNICSMVVWPTLYSEMKRASLADSKSSKMVARLTPSLHWCQVGRKGMRKSPTKRVERRRVNATKIK